MPFTVTVYYDFQLSVENYGFRELISSRCSFKLVSSKAAPAEKNRGCICVLELIPHNRDIT